MNFKEIFKKHTMEIVLVLVIIFFSITTQGRMVQATSFTSLISQNAYVYVLAIGMLMCMLIKGNIDLSVGATVCLIDAIGAQLMVNFGVPVFAAMAIMLVVGIVIGAVLGFIIAYLNIPPWIATLAGFLAFRGLGTAVVGQNGSIGGIPDSFINMFNGTVPDVFGIPGFNLTCLLVGIVGAVLFVILQIRARNNKIKKGYEAESKNSLIIRCAIICAIIIIFAIKLAMDKGIPFTLIWVMVIAIIYDFIISKTTIGRYFYAMGGNMEATRLSGINTKAILFLAYLNMQFLTVIAAWMTMARLTSANPNAGTNFEMDAISACIVGGVSAYGGSGSVFGMFVGATLIGVINIGMSLMGIDANWQKIVKGFVLLAAVVFEIMNKKQKGKK